MPELRQNIITGDWVVVAPERAKRPKDFIMPKSVKVPAKNCPFCPGSEGYKQNVAEKEIKAEYKNVYVVKNRFAAFVESESEKSLRSFYPEAGFYRAKSAIGVHDVIAIKEHGRNLFQFGPELLNEFLEVIKERYLWIKKEKKATFILPIYNHGAEAAASIDHAHAQIIASNIVTGSIERELAGSGRYFGINGVCVFCDIIKHELKEKIRIVDESENFIAIAFYAPRFPFETWILPKKHESQFEEISKSKMEEFSHLFDRVLKKIDKTLENPPLNFCIHTLPTTLEGSEYYHWHLEITPRVALYGGYEIGSNIIINTMPPEEAAEYLNN